MRLPGCLTFVCVVDAEATAQVDDLDVHEMLMVSRQHLQKCESRFHFELVTCLMWRCRVEKTDTSMMVLPRWTWTPTITTLHSMAAVKLA